jgi:hypothetical protein
VCQKAKTKEDALYFLFISYDLWYAWYTFVPMARKWTSMGKNGLKDIKMFGMNKKCQFTTCVSRLIDETFFLRNLF